MTRPQQECTLGLRVLVLATLLATTGLILSNSVQGETYKSRISPQWSADNSHLWYRNNLAKGT